MEAVIELRPDLYALAKENKRKKDSTYNIEGTADIYVMCDLENKALMAAFDFLVEEGIEVGSLVFDGLMIYKENVPVERLPQILEGCSQRVKRLSAAK